MKKIITYYLVFVFLLAACEDVYTPDIDNVENAIVVDARIEKGSDENYIILTKSKNFNEEFNDYPEVSGGKVILSDNLGNEYELPEYKTGQFYVYPEIESGREYKIQINYNGNIFESEFEKVPDVPDLDTVYGIPTLKQIEVAGENDVDEFREIKGVQLYADMKTTPENPYYRFTAQQVMQYLCVVTTEMFSNTHYYWKKTDAPGIFNIAAPPEYSNTNEIIKHPLYFFRQSVTLQDTIVVVGGFPEIFPRYLNGWIMVLYQHAISGSAYNYYNDLNAQLEADGKIFDPVYVQARSNIKCINDPKEIVLGNFEISNVTEHRYYIRFISEVDGYEIREVFDRSYIPWSGHTIDIPPPFWQR